MAHEGTWDWMWRERLNSPLPEPAKHEPREFRDGYAWAYWFHECHIGDNSGHYIYVISQAQPPEATGAAREMQALKIGRAKNVSKRLSQLQTGNPNTLRVEIAFQVNRPVYDEDSAQNTFPGERGLGEWFWTPALTVQGIRVASNELYPGDFNG